MLSDYPIFEKWYSLLDWILDRVDSFPKSVRVTISTHISNLALDTLELVIEMVYTKDKKPILNSINLKLEKLRIFFRLCKDRRYLAISQYEFVSKEINAVGLMVGGLLKA
ncbi:MAG: diversity-generating retroelement protein Avd [Candidatus Delongbacteria bacterium]|nr:diversity-generating retroelement protein Avd [Candidatus Delongbacteria bacterium]MCG2760779.1 diversity-generating retroelement protein Avd [Candidatus Delongbacteria bacterium]